MQKLPVPNITLNTQDQGATFQGKMNALADACKTSVQAYNNQIDAAQTAKQFSDAAQQALINADVTPILDRFNLLSKGLPTIDFDFANNDYRVYQPAGLSPITLIEAITSSRNSEALHNSPYRLEVAPANVPRIECSPASGKSLGLLSEDLRSNLLNNIIYNGADGKTPPTGWSNPVSSGQTITEPSTRLSLAIKVKQSGINQREFFRQTLTLPANTTVTFSAYFHEVIGTTVGILQAASTGADNPTGTLVLNGTAFVKPGIYSITFTTGSTGGVYRFDAGLGTNTSTTGTVTHETPQVEVGIGYTSTIPTSSSSASRFADLNYKQMTQLLNINLGTVLWEGFINDSTDSRGIISLGAMGSSINSCICLIQRSSGSVQFIARSDDNFVQFTVGNSQLHQFNKVGFCYDFINQIALVAINGVISGPITLPSKPLGFTDQDIALILGRYRRLLDPQQNQICSRARYYPHWEGESLTTLTQR